MDVRGGDRAKRGGDAGRAARVAQVDAPVAVLDRRPLPEVARPDLTEAVAYRQCALDVGDVNRAVVVRGADVARVAGDFNLTEGILQTLRPPAVAERHAKVGTCGPVRRAVHGLPVHPVETAGAPSAPAMISEVGSVVIIRAIKPRFRAAVG